MSKNYHHGDLKSALIKTARTQLATDGVASLSLRALARALKVTHPAVYRHFADKDALLEAVAQEGFEELADALYESVGETQGLEPRLQACATTYLNFALKNPELLRVMFAIIPAEARMKNEPLYAASKRAYSAILESVQELQGDLYVSSAVIWATLHGLAGLTIEKQIPKLVDPSERAVIVAKAVAVLSKGLA